MTEKVLFGFDDYQPHDLQRIEEAASGWAEVAVIECEPPEEQYREVLRGVTFAIGWPAPSCARESQLRVLQCPSVGVDTYVGHNLADKTDFTFCNARGVASIGLAEHCLAMMLAIARHLPKHLADQRQGRWDNPLWERQDNIYGELAGSQVCIVGVGSAGREIARRCFAMGMTVVGVDPQIDHDEPSLSKIYEPSRLSEAVAESDHVVISAPGGPKTESLINDDIFCAMKPGAFLYNIARGTIVDESALIRHLESGRLGGAGLDVFREEPLTPDSPLWQMDNVIITPHMAGFSAGYNDRMIGLFVENLLAFRDGQPLSNVISQLSSTDRHPAMGMPSELAQ